MARDESRLFLGIGGHVVALDRATGSELWRTKVKSSTLVSISVSGDKVFAGAYGELFCLHATSGELLWSNRLKGLGLGPILFSGDGSMHAAAAAAAAAAAC